MLLMVKYILFIILSLFNFFIVFYGALFPKCALCGKTKIKMLFRYVLNNNISIRRSGQTSICRKCAVKYNICECDECENMIEIIKRAEYKSKYI